MLKKALASSGIVLAVAGAGTTGTSVALREPPLEDLFMETPTAFSTEVGEDGVTRYRTIITYKEPPTEAQLDALDSLPERVEETGPRKLLNFLPGDPLPKSTSGALTHSWHLIPAAAALLTEDELRELQKDPAVKSVHFDLKMEPFLVSSQWHMESRGPHVYGQTGSGVGVCVIGAGIAANPWLNLHSGHNPWPPGNGRPVPGQTSGHETFMASIIASHHPLYGGIAPDVNLMSYDFASLYYGEAAMVDGAEWCVDNGAKVIAFSYGFTDHTYPSHCDGLPVSDAFNAAFDAGVVVVNASGNSSWNDGLPYPVCASKVVSVGNINTYDQRCCGSNGGSGLTLVAQGQVLASVGVGGRITGGGGTSFSCPHVAGVAALIIGAVPGITPAEVVAAMTGTALDLGTAGRDTQYGWGLVQANQAVRRAMTGAGLPDPGAHDMEFWPLVDSSTDFTANWSETGGGGWHYVAGSWTDKPTGGDALYDNFPHFELYQQETGWPVHSSFRLDNCPTECTLTHTPVDLSAYTGAQLRFFTGIDDALDRDDYLIVEAKDNTGNWRKIFTGSGGSNNTNVTIINYKVLSGAYMHSNFTIRVRGSIDKYNEEAYFDAATLIEWPVD